jgi:hypothetical protein
MGPEIYPPYAPGSDGQCPAPRKTPSAGGGLLRSRAAGNSALRRRAPDNRFAFGRAWAGSGRNAHRRADLSRYGWHGWRSAITAALSLTRDEFNPPATR